MLAAGWAWSGASSAAAAPAGAPADAAGDRAALLANTVAMLAGTAASNARSDVAGKLAAIDRTATSRLKAMDAAGAGELFSGKPLGTSDANLTASFQYLYEIALATRTPGGSMLGDTDLQHRVIDGLSWLYDNYYGDQSKGYYGNWFNWEIGISNYVSRTLVLLTEQMDSYAPQLPATYVAAMDAYLRNGKNGDVDLDSRFHTGANLADITTNRILQGAVLGDDARITKAVADQSTAYATVDPYHLQHGVTDGYYADGSFIQHASVAYTGSYGKGLLTRVVQTIKILDGTSYATGGDLVDVVRGWVVNGFAPLIFEGWMMEMVKGRAVSRTTTGYSDVAGVVEAIVDLSAYATGAAGVALQSYVKFIRSTSRASLDPSTFVSPVSVARYADILADDSVPAEDINPPARSVAFNAMDRAVHRRPGYAFALSRSSARISEYEYMLGENLMPWFQGAGTHYLYLSGQDQTAAYGVDYYTTVSPYRLSGVTSPVEERKTIPELYGEQFYDNPDSPLNFTSSSESQNTYVYFPVATNAYSGGATLDAYGAVGMVLSDDVPWVDKQKGVLPDDFVAYQNARATKSWFMLDDEIVMLAAGVSDPQGRAVVTTMDSRIAAPSDDVKISGARWDGTSWSGTGTGELRWLRYANATQGTSVGYLFLDRQQVSVANERVTNSRRIVRQSNPDTAVTKQVFGVSVGQPAGAAPSSLAYAVVPNAAEGKLRTYDRGPLTVLVNTTRVQAIRHDGLRLTAVNAFADGWQHAATLAVNGAASVLMRETDGGGVSIAVSDPTMSRDSVDVLVHGPSMRLTSADDGVTARGVAGGTMVTVTTHQAYGRTFTATLR
ncbi:MAG TPA: polysaccharide lyase family 8 super-sandwich domain-containing protein [Streptosporangiales bacterium]